MRWAVLSRSFVVLLRKNVPQSRNLKAAALLGVMLNGEASLDYFEGIRGRFRKFVSDDQRYKDFICAVNSNNGGVLPYRKEQEWSNFLREQNLKEISFETILSIFRICHLHETDLISGEVEAFHGHLNYSKIYLLSKRQLFPCANFGPIMVNSKFGSKRVQVWYCAKCREAEIEYKSRKA